MLKLLITIGLLSLLTKTHANDQDLENQLMGNTETLTEEEIELDKFYENKYIEASNDPDLDDGNIIVNSQVDPDLIEDGSPDIDFTEIDKIRENEKDQDKHIQKIVQSKKFRKFNYAEKEALKIKLKHIVQSGTFLANINRGTQLIHLRSGKIYYTQKNLTVNAYRKNDYEGYKLLINKNGYSTYKVKASKVNSIREIVKLYESPLKYRPVIKKKVLFRIKDNELKYNTQFNIHAGLTNPKFISDLGNMADHIGQTVRYEASVYGNFEFPVKAGFTLQWENMFGNLSSGGKYNMYALSFGPSFKSSEFKIGQSMYRAFFQTRLAAFSKVAINSPANTANYSSSQTSIALGIEHDIKTILGTFIIGGNYQRQWMKASSEQFIADISSQNNYNDSYVLTVGHGSDWIW